jgi:hypothetical protein
LPTELDEQGEIKDWSKFEEQHRRAIRLIQWLEPIILAVYGFPDPFSKLNKSPFNRAFSAASQRCAISRYIGIGTYDSEKMPKGKILVKSVDEIYPIHDPEDVPKEEPIVSWIREYYRDNGYTALSEIGMDINFNKHYCHGIEIRFLDHIDDPKDLEKVCQFFIYLMDHALDQDFLDISIENPAKSQLWHTLVLNVMREGKTYVCTDEEYKTYCQLVAVNLTKTGSVKDLYEYLFCFLENRYQKEKVGGFSSLVLPEQSIVHLDHSNNDFTKENEKTHKDALRKPLFPSFQRCTIL